MRPLVALIVGTVLLAACSSSASMSASPIASVASSPSPTPSPTTSAPPITASPTPLPSPTPTSDATAVALADVEIRPIPTRAPASGCTADDSVARKLDRAMTLADMPITYQVQSGGLRDGEFGYSDSVPGPPLRFDASEEHDTVEARAGDVVRLEPGSTITLIDGRLELYRLDQADHAGDVEAIATADLGGDASGLDVPLPTQAGRWLLSVRAQWQTDCAGGDGYVDLLVITT